MNAPYWSGDGVSLFLGDARLVREWLACDVLLTDPPYGMRFVSGHAVTRRPIANDHDTGLRDALLALWGAKPAAVFGTWKAPRPAAMRKMLIWDRTDGTGPGMGDVSDAFGSSHEEIYLLGDWPKPEGVARRGTVLRTNGAMGSPGGYVVRSGHPTAKPTELLEAILRSAPPGSVADPCAGTGATLIAARALGRSAIGVEIEERYAERAALRLSQLPLFVG